MHPNIDAGHGGRDPGAVYNGRREKDDTLSLTSVNASLSNPFFIAFDKAWEGRDPETATWPARRTFSWSLTLNF